MQLIGKMPWKGWIPEAGLLPSRKVNQCPILFNVLSGRTFHVAYGQDRMSSETKEAILYGQLQEGLPLEFFRGPAVLGALGYKEFCVVAAKGKERRLSKLKKRQAYLHQGNSQAGNIPKPITTNQSPVKRAENG